MYSIIERKARKLLVAATLAFAVGAPTIACMGGGTEMGPEEAKAAMQGNFTAQGHPDSGQPFKVAVIAVKPNSDLAQLEKALGRAPTQQEKDLFEEIKRRGKNDPEVQFLLAMAEALKSATFSVDGSSWSLNIAGASEKWPYTINSANGNVLDLTVQDKPGGTNWIVTVDSETQLTVDIRSSAPLKLIMTKQGAGGGGGKGGGGKGRGGRGK